MASSKTASKIDNTRKKNGEVNNIFNIKRQMVEQLLRWQLFQRITRGQIQPNIFLLAQFIKRSNKIRGEKCTRQLIDPFQHSGQLREYIML
ncbi:hypothetical protein SDC9_188466 [bioreactor metagenome]|uniref:Uncharacterized protein n=1 Tax=bioreactor metagenome TaxID=1076179 RepID=A0A645HQT7_9ZZZZ